MNKVCIIIPVYNTKKYLKQCIESVLHQSYTDFSLILVDDASTDGSREICDYYAHKDMRIKLIQHNVREGVSSSRYDGFQHADAEWVCFIDSDDMISEDMLEHMYRYVGRGNNYDLICVRGINAGKEEMEAEWDCRDRREKIFSSFENEEAFLQVYNKRISYLSTQVFWGKLIKKKIVDIVVHEVECYKDVLPHVYFEDLFFIPRIWLHSKKTVLLDGVYYRHRVDRNSSLSNTFIPTDYHYEMIEASNIMLDYFNNNTVIKAHNSYLDNCALLIQKIWFMSWKAEKERQKFAKIDQSVTNFFIKNRIYLFRGEFSKERIIAWVSVRIFMVNREFWGKIMQKAYFKTS